MSDGNEHIPKSAKVASLNPQETVLGLDVDGKAVDKDKVSYKTSVFMTCLFPFLAFRRPESRIFRFNIFPVGLIARFLWNKVAKKATTQGGVDAQAYVSNALSFMFLMFGTLVLVFYIVYTCFSFSSADAFPTVGAEFQWVLLFRSLLVIAVLQSVCFGLCHPNRDRIKMLTMDMSQFDKDLSYVGVVHTFRKFTAFVMRQPFRMRWFTTFLSDSILLVITYLFTIAFRVCIIVGDPEVSTIIQHIVAIYRNLLTCGFIVYTLEFAPRVDAGNRGGYSAAILVLIATQISDFFLFVSEKSAISNLVVRWIGSIAQLYITHSAALLAVIQANHHVHTHLSPDLTWKGFSKLMLIVVVLGGLWTAFSIFRYIYAYDHDGEYNHNWIPVSYPYIYWPLSVASGLLFCIAGIKYLAKPSHSALPLISLQSKRAILSVGDDGADNGGEINLNEIAHENDSDDAAAGGEDHSHDSSSPSSRKTNSGVSFDFDITLIMMTFVVACLYYTSNFYAAARGHHYTTMAYYLTVPLAPIGLGAFALSTWIKPPKAARLGLYGAMLLTLMLLVSVMSYEDCEMSADVPLCCEYPWLPDTNHEFEEPHSQPSCSGLMNQYDQCLTFFVDLAAGNSTESEGSYVIPLSFSAVYESTRGLQVDGYIVNKTSLEIIEHYFSELTTEIDSVLENESCQPNDITQYTRNSSTVYGPGCYGDYTFRVTGEDALRCNPENNVTCLFKVSTLNCAFIKSEPLPFITITVNETSQTSALTTHVAAPPDRDVPDSSFFNFFRLVGLAGLLECFFCIFGVVLKIAFLTECRTARVEQAISHSSISRAKRPTIIYSVKSD